MRCKTFFRNPTRSKISIQNLWGCEKNGSKSDAFEILDSKYDVWYNKWFKNWLFSKVLIPKKLFKGKKNNFFRNNFSENAQKKPILTFFGVIWPDKWFFESELFNNVRFPKNSFFIEIYCLVKTLIQVLMLCGYSIYTLTRSNFFVIKSEAS